MWWIMSSLIALLLAVLVWLVVFQDGPPPDDSAILPHWSHKGGKNNPLAVFTRELKIQGIRDFEGLPREVRTPEQGAEEDIRKLLEKHPGVFQAFDTLLMTTPQSWQWPDAEHVSDGLGTTNIGGCVAFMDALKMKIHLLCHDGRGQDAARLALQGARFGRGLQAAEGAAIHMLIGTQAQKNSEFALKKALTAQSADPEMLRFCLTKLNEMGAPQRDDCQFVIRAEYLCEKNDLSRIHRADLSNLGNSRGVTKSLGEMVPGLLYKPNRALALRVRFDTDRITALDSSWNDGLTSERRCQETLDEYFDKAATTIFAPDTNFGGMSVLYEFNNISGDLVRSMAKAVTLHDQIRVMLAMRIFDLERHGLPMKLDELVPDYLAAVPEDVFSNNAMSWNKDSRVLYSFGANTKDEGGAIDEEKPHFGADFGMRYWWNKPPLASSKP
jgi:hypothetical protein